MIDDGGAATEDVLQQGTEIGPAPPREPGRLAHPRRFGAALLALCVLALWGLAAAVKDQPAESGSYGQLEVSVADDVLLWPRVALLVIAGVASVSTAMVVRGRPANRTMAVILIVSLGTPFLAPLLAGRTSTVFSAGVGCVGGTYTREEVRAMWEGRRTVGEVLTGGLLDGNVADYLIPEDAVDMDAAGCSGST